MVRWGVLGLGRAANSFANAIKEVENAKMTSIASLSKKANLKFGEKFNIEKNFQFNSYEDLINCEEIDAVYIATLNNKHADLIIKVAQAKKGILCEKPMSLTETESKQVFNQLNKSKVFFLENIAYRSHPQTIEITNQILNNEIGNVTKVESSFGFRVNPILKFKPRHRLFNKNLGGGAINDIGCYPVSLAVLIARLFQSKNKETSFSVIDVYRKNNFRGTDDEGFLKINFHNLFEAVLEISIKKNLIKPTIIYGSKGKIIIPNPWLPNKNTTIQLITGKNNYIKKITSKYSVYANTIKAASDEIQQNNNYCEYPNMTWQDSIINSKILTEWKN
ncbi:Gfo/Idh/MocA family oxidoreductase [Candidatus Pelagibacter sp.]|nr:Gfo/Idh/MocA family oxidoreductase [Candidatus Pelagibacter sp.]